MLAQQLRESSSLFDSLDAMRDWRALLLLATLFVAAAVLWGAGGWMLASTGGSAPLFLCAALAIALLLWGANFAGILMMDQASGQPRRALGQAMRASIGATQQWVLVLLALGLFYLLGLLALTVLLLVCSVPVVGPWLYALVFPVGAVASGLALVILPTLVLPLCGPAIWSGLDASTALAQLWAAMRHRLPLVLSWMLLLSCITAALWLALAAVLFAGFAVTNSVSASILGTQQAPWPGAGSPLLQSLTAPGAAFLTRGTGGVAAYLQSAALGSMALWAAACAIPSLVAMRGACIVYRRALLGLNTAQEEQVLNQTLASAKSRARGLCDSAAPKSAKAATDLASGAESLHPPIPSIFSFPSPSSPAVAKRESESSQVHSVMRAWDERVAAGATYPSVDRVGESLASPTPTSLSSSGIKASAADWPAHPENSAEAWRDVSLPATARSVDESRRGSSSVSWHSQSQPGWHSQSPVAPLSAAPAIPNALELPASATAASAMPNSPLDVDLEVPFTLPGAASLPSHAVGTPKPCPFCGRGTESGDFFCGHCGHALPK